MQFFCNILFVKKINFEMFVRKELFSVNFFRKKIFLRTLFRKFSFHEKICFWNFLILNYFFSKEIIFLVRCSSRNIVIFLIVSKEIQKYDQRKFFFFSEKKHFQIWYSRSSLKKKSQEIFTIFFSVNQNWKQKNSQ